MLGVVWRGESVLSGRRWILDYLPEEYASVREDVCRCDVQGIRVITGTRNTPIRQLLRQEQYAIRQGLQESGASAGWSALRTSLLDERLVFR